MSVDRITDLECQARSDAELIHHHEQTIAELERRIESLIAACWRLEELVGELWDYDVDGDADELAAEIKQAKEQTRPRMNSESANYKRQTANYGSIANGWKNSTAMPEHNSGRKSRSESTLRGTTTRRRAPSTTRQPMPPSRRHARGRTT